MNIKFFPNRVIRIIAVALVFASINAMALTTADSRHLWGRTGYGNVGHFDKTLRYMSRSQAVDFVLQHPKSIPYKIIFDENGYLAQKRKGRTKMEKRQFRKTIQRADRKRLSVWWHNQIINTKNPLEEKMTVFWHRHFTSDLKKVAPPIMHGQNMLFRKHALGNFSDLLKATLRNPAIHLYLDNQKNTAKKPNENLARELLELYTMGEGQGYTEDDIGEIARALTGYRPKNSLSKMTLIDRRHDSGIKSILGESGYYGLDSVIDIILRQPQTAKHIARKIVNEFLTENPSDYQVAHYASILRSGGYEIKPLLRAIFNSDEFWEQRNSLVKSPYDMFKSSFSLMPEGDIDKRVINAISKSGQQLFYPPDVKGWRTGQSWLSSDLILARMRMINTITKPMKGEKLSNKAVLYALDEPGYKSKHRKWAIRQTLKHDNFNFK
jgi:uncharacterized protein (DUF1800 family)